MIKKYETLKKVEAERIVAIVRVKSEEEALRGTEALLEGGLSCVELALTTPFAHTVLEALKKKFGDALTLGAGSVLDAESARIAILSGAQYLVTPTFSADVVRLANRYGAPVFAGVATATEALAAMESGVDVVKLFPAAAYPFGIIKDLKAPMPNLEIMPVGGVNAENIGAWLRAGAFACGVGGALFAGLKTKNYPAIAAAARALKQSAAEA